MGLSVFVIFLDYFCTTAFPDPYPYPYPFPDPDPDPDPDSDSDSSCPVRLYLHLHGANVWRFYSQHVAEIRSSP